MRSHVRTALLVLLAGGVVALAVPVAADAAEFPSIEKLAAVNCNATHPQCAHKIVEKELPPPFNGFFGPQKYSVTEPAGPTEAKKAEEEGEQRAGAHVPFGVTDFTLGHIGSLPEEIPTQVVKHIRTDVAAGLATNPFAVPMCSAATFDREDPRLAHSGLYEAPSKECEEKSKIGIQEATVFVETEPEHPETSPKFDLGLKGNVYDLEPGLAPKGPRPALYGVAVPLPIALTKGKLEALFVALKHPFTKAEEEELANKQWYSHTLIEGSVEWGLEAAGTGAADYHDYFEIDPSTELPLISSRLVFFGNKSAEGKPVDFVTNATSCPGDNTTFLTITDLENKPVREKYTTPVGLKECGNVPFVPTFGLFPATAQQDTPDGLSATLTSPRFPAAEIDSAELKTAEFALPEGMTLNPAAAAGLTACTPAQARIHGSEKGTSCPSTSEIGTVALNVPTLPDGSLTGKLYLGGPEGGGPITGPPYVMYVDAESTQYGISVRLEGKVIPNEATGRLTTVFENNPEQPFKNITFSFKTGALAPVANPLTCGTVNAYTSLLAYTGAHASPGSNPFTFNLSPTGGPCATPPPFTPAQSTTNQQPAAGSNTSFTFNLERPDGNQYVSQVKTTLPEGLVGAIPDATQCPEPGAAKGECPSSSQIGVAAVQAGAGPTPYSFSGPVYLTGPYNGAPFGMSIPVPAVAGPFNLGTVVTRATINIDEHTARVIVGSTLPRIVKGVPLRLKRIAVSVNKQGFLKNPTNCSALATESVISGFTPETGATASASLSSPFQVTNCGALSFKPSFKAATSAKYSRGGGASLETTINQPSGEANIKSVLVQLPSALPSRQATFSKACLPAVFAANPYNCGPSIGGARANTPLLPTKMTGPAYYVARGGAQFPDIDLVLNGDGVRVILVGETKITKGITTTHFATPPDVPVSSITVNLPMGSNSALSGFGNFCRSPLYMPTTIEGQNGKVFKQKTSIKVNNCGVQVVGQKRVGNTAYLTVKTFGAGRVSASGSGVVTTARHFNGAVNAASLKVQLTRGGRVQIRVGFFPKNSKEGTSVAYVTV